MDLALVSVVADTAAAFGVVGSLIFVGMQVNQNTRATISQEDDATYSPWNEMFLTVVSSSDFADILVRGQLDGMAALSAGECERFSKYQMTQFSNFEKGFRIWRRDPSIFDPSWLRNMVDDAVKADGQVANKGSREFWADSKGYYTPQFVAWVDQTTLEE